MTPNRSPTRQGKAMLSGYASELYSPLETAGWHRIDFLTACHAAGCTRASGIQGEGTARRLQQRTETVWMNYTIQQQMLQEADNGRTGGLSH